jgi:L-ascorbate metabolism protein UlaG (beta-lactamase superfamily)
MTLSTCQSAPSPPSSPPPEVWDWLNKHGVTEAQLSQVNMGGTARFAFGSVQMMQAVHSSSMPNGAAGGNACGFLIRTPGGSFSDPGDTASTLHLQLIPRRGPLDRSVLSLSDTFTTDAEDALDATRLVRRDEVGGGVHFNTRQPSAIDWEAALSCFSNAGKRVRLPPCAELSL